jgi:hypothetical protein
MHKCRAVLELRSSSATLRVAATEVGRRRIGGMDYQVGERVRSKLNLDKGVAKGDVVTILELNISTEGHFDGETAGGQHVALLPEQVEPEHPAQWSR